MASNPEQDQLTCVIEALRALEYIPPENLDTDAALDEVRDGLIDLYNKITGHPMPQSAVLTEAARKEWLEFRCFEQQTLGLR